MSKIKFKKFDTKKMILKEVNKNLVKFIISNKKGNLKSLKIIKLAYKYFYFYKFSSISFFKRCCLHNGNGRSVFRFFKLSRFNCRLYAAKSMLIGLRKASF